MISKIINPVYNEYVNDSFTPPVKMHIVAFSIEKNIEHVSNIMSYVENYFDIDPARFFEIRKKDSEADFPLYETYGNFKEMARAIGTTMESGDRGKIHLNKTEDIIIRLSPNGEKVIFNYFFDGEKHARKFLDYIKNI